MNHTQKTFSEELVEIVCSAVKLGEKDKIVIKERFAGRTLEEVSQGIGVTRERVRQIEQRALETLKGFYLSVKINAYDSVQAEIRNLKNKAWGDLCREVSVPEVSAETLKTQIEDLKLSARVSDMLFEAGIRTIGGLMRKKEEDILCIPGMGQVGIKEIREALKRYDVGFRDTYDSTSNIPRRVQF